MNLRLAAADSVGLRYQVGSSLGAGPIPIDTRVLGLSPDGLLWLSVAGALPTVFAGYAGAIDSRGDAQAAVKVPWLPGLAGLKIHSAFVTVDPGSPSGIRSISNTFAFSIVR